MDVSRIQNEYYAQFEDFIDLKSISNSLCNWVQTSFSLKAEQEAQIGTRRVITTQLLVVFLRKTFTQLKWKTEVLKQAMIDFKKITSKKRYHTLAKDVENGELHEKTHFGKFLIFETIQMDFINEFNSFQKKNNLSWMSLFPRHNLTLRLKCIPKPKLIMKAIARIVALDLTAPLHVECCFASYFSSATF